MYNPIINFKLIYLFVYLFIESCFSLNIFVKSETKNNLKHDYFYNETFNKEKLFVYKNYDLKNILKNNLLNSSNKLVNLILENKEIDKRSSGIEIISDTQYQLDGTYYAEGNVVVILEDGELKADKLIYNQLEKNLILEGNISYFKGNQYVEATYLSFSFKEDKGYLKDVYGVFDLSSFSDDVGFKFEEEIDIDNKNYEANKIKDIKYENSSNIGLENTFESGEKFNITEFQFNVPQIKKWRFKANKISIEKDRLFSDGILFTNDPFNKPQFLLESKYFSVKTLKDKIRIISKNTWLNLDEKVSFPIGRRKIIDRDPISRWGIGSDYEDKDGFYLSRSFNTRKIFDKYDLRITPYLLFQRVLKGNTNSFVKKNSSILSNKVSQDISLSDYFAVNTSLKGSINSWFLDINTDLNSLDYDRFSNAFRGRVTLEKSIDFNSRNTDSGRESTYLDNELKFQLFGAYRQKVPRSFTEDEEIYLGKGFAVSNNKSWQNKNFKNQLSVSYGIGEFEAKELKSNNLKTSIRNVITATYKNEIPIWQKQKIDDEIDNSYKYSPKVVNQGLNWLSSVNSGIYFYGDGSNQNAISFSSGPRIILGSFKKNLLDYTDLNVQANFIIKNGESPFAFDDIDNTQKLSLYFEQQIIGPLLFNYDGFLNLDNNSIDYGKFSNNTYALNIKRRAYSIGAFYKESTHAFGIQFKLNNFNYLGSSSRF